MSETPERAPLSRLEAGVLILNLVLLAVVVLYLLVAQSGSGKVAPLVEGDRRTTSRIAQLERALRLQPANLSHAIELARLYREAGEFPWSVQALRSAEKKGSREPAWRLMLGLAYLELGRNDDALRVLARAQKSCRREGGCSANVRVKLEIFNKLVRKLRKRGIDARQHFAAAEEALHEILKPVNVDPDKMRPKAPVQPARPVRQAPAAEKRPIR